MTLPEWVSLAILVIALIVAMAIYWTIESIWLDRSKIRVHHGHPRNKSHR
jgi:hypothetical protein